MGKSQIRRSNQKVQLKNSGLQKESNQIKQRKLNGERKQLHFTNLDLSQILQKQKLV